MSGRTLAYLKHTGCTLLAPPSTDTILNKHSTASLYHQSLKEMASTVASSVVFGCGDVDLTLLQYGSISDGGGGGGVGAGTGTGGDGNLHLSQDGEGGGDDDKNDDCSLSEGGATISLAIAASMTGGRVNGDALSSSV
nr:hypothetical protein [Tanacetum cinerariifolium]